MNASVFTYFRINIFKSKKYFAENMDRICVPEDCNSDGQCPQVGSPCGEGTCMGECQPDGTCLYQGAIYADAPCK